MSLVEQLHHPTEPMPTTNRSASLLDLASPLSPSVLPLGELPTSHGNPNLSLQLPFREKGKLWWTVKGISTVMPEDSQGHHRFLPGNLGVVRAEGFSVRSIAQLFHLANNFTFWDGWYQEPTSGRSLKKIIQEYDSDVLRLLRDIEASKVKDVQTILFHGGHPTIDAIKEKVFATALRTGNLQLVKLFLSTGSGIHIDTVLNDTNGARATPMEVAASMDDEQASLEMVSLLIRHKACLNARRPIVAYPGWRSAAFRAAYLGHLVVLRTLLNAGSTACRETRRLAVEHGDELLEMVFSGISHPDLDSWVVTSVSDLPGWRCYYPDLDYIPSIHLTAVGLAALKGNLTTVQTLIRMGCDLHATQELYCGAVGDFYTGTSKAHIRQLPTSTTAVAPAILGGHHGMVKFLLDNGVSVDCEEHFSPLLTACYCGRSDILMTLINAGAGVHTADECGTSFTTNDPYWKKKSYTRLSTLLGLLVLSWGANGQMDMQVCEHLISEGARVDHALFEATRLRNMPFISLLLNTTALSLSEEFGQAALACAINTGFIEAARELFDKGAVLSDPKSILKIETQEMFRFLEATEWLHDILRENGPPILTSIILTGNRDHGLQVLQRCVALGVNLDPRKSTEVSIVYTATTKYYCTTPLDAAILTNDADLLSILLQHGAPWSQDTLGFAVQSEQPLDLLNVLISSHPCELQRVGNRIDMSKFHVEHDPEMDENSCGIAEAAISGNLDIIKLLLDAFYWGDSKLGIALTAAVASAAERGTVKTLMDAGASLDQRCYLLRSGSDLQYLVAAESPIHAAIQRKNSEALKMLITAGADPNQGRDINIKPLQLACKLGNLEMVNYLLEMGADVNAPAAAYFGATALQYASIGGYLKIVVRLLNAGAHINADRTERLSTTALQGAAQFGRLEMMHLLLRWNPKVHGRYRGEYIRAVKLAEENGHMAVSRVLKSYGRWKAQWDDWYNATMLTKGGRYEFRAAFEVSEDEHELYESPVEKYSSSSNSSETSSNADDLEHRQQHVSDETIVGNIDSETSLETGVSEIYGSPSDILTGIQGYVHGLGVEAGSSEQKQMDVDSVNDLEGYDMGHSMMGSGNLEDLLEQWVDI